MGDVYWMSAIFLLQGILSAVICAVMSKNTETIIGTDPEGKN